MSVNWLCPDDLACPLRSSASKSESASRSQARTTWRLDPCVGGRKRLRLALALDLHLHFLPSTPYSPTRDTRKHHPLSHTEAAEQRCTADAELTRLRLACKGKMSASSSPPPFEAQLPHQSSEKGQDGAQETLAHCTSARDKAPGDATFARTSVLNSQQGRNLANCGSQSTPAQGTATPAKTSRATTFTSRRRSHIDLCSTCSSLDRQAPSGGHDQDRKSTRLNSSHSGESRMPSSA